MSISHLLSLQWSSQITPERLSVLSLAHVQTCKTFRERCSATKNYRRLLRHCGFFEITLNVFFHLPLSIGRYFLRNVVLIHACIMLVVNCWVPLPWVGKTSKYRTSLLLQLGKSLPIIGMSLLLLLSPLSPLQLSSLFKLLVLSNLRAVCWAVLWYTCLNGQSQIVGFLSGCLKVCLKVIHKAPKDSALP